MDKVLFLLNIPEEEEVESEKGSNKQNEVKSAEKNVPNQAASSTTDSEVDPTRDRQRKFSLGFIEGKFKAGEEAEGILRRSQEKQSDSCPDISFPNGLPVQTTTLPVTDSSRPDLSEQPLATSDKGSSTSGLPEGEVCKTGAGKMMDEEVTETSSVSTGGSAMVEKPQYNDSEDLGPVGVGLINMEMIGRELSDDFWDFGEPVKENAPEPEVSSVPFTQDSQNQETTQTNCEEESEDTETGDQSRKEVHGFPPCAEAEDLEDSSATDFMQPNDQKKRNSEGEEEFTTCPNTPIGRLKGLGKDAPRSAVAEKPASKFNISPVHEAAQPGKSENDTDVTDDSGNVGESSNKDSEESGKKAAACDDRLVQSSGKFTTTLVKEDSIQSSEAGKGGNQVGVKKKFVPDNVAMAADTKPENTIFKVPVNNGALTNNLSSKVDPASEAENNQGRSSPVLCKPSTERKKSLAVGIISDVSTSVDDSVGLVDFLPKMSLRMLVRDCLKNLGIRNVAWQKCTGDRVWQVTFIENSGVRCENIMLKLAAIGVGRVQRSSISILPVTIHAENEGETQPESTMESMENEQNEEKVHQLEEKTTEFQKSIKSRLVVRQVVKSVESNAEFTFDYVMLVILASIIAALGLLENSSVSLVASMLISPLMGPILAGTFGIVIKSNGLRNLGIRSELFGLGICLMMGFLVGLIQASLEAGALKWRTAEEWPTAEMTARGAVRGLLVGMFIALPSGAGVALSVLGGNVGSLVGVAISASLLPPAVNAGMLWASALVAAIAPQRFVVENRTITVYDMINGISVPRQESQMVKVPGGRLGCYRLENNNYENFYFCNSAADYATLGTISLLLTILNIFCIIIMGVVVLKIKEVAPKTSTHMDQNFFKKDIKIARESYTTAKGPQSTMMGKKWLEEYKALKQMELGNNEVEEDTIEFQHILEAVEHSPEVNEVLGRIPNMHLRKSASGPVSVEMAGEFHNAALKHLEKHPELESVYQTLSYHHSPRHSMFSPHATAGSPNSVYHTVRSVYHTTQSPFLVPNTQSPAFLFPPGIGLHPDSLSSTTRLPVISENIELDDKKIESNSKRQGKRSSRLVVPKFHVTHLPEQQAVESLDKETDASKPSESQPKGKEGKAKREKGRKGFMPKSSPQKKGQKLADPLVEEPLLSRGARTGNEGEISESDRV